MYHFRELVYSIFWPIWKMDPNSRFGTVFNSFTILLLKSNRFDQTFGFSFEIPYLKEFALIFLAKIKGKI